VVGLAISVALLAWTLHGVDLGAVAGHIRRADPWFFALTITCATLTFPLRAIRWRVILPGPDGSAFPFTPLWRAVAVGFMANNLLPARIGEVVRAYFVTRELPVRFSTALASIAAERVFDGLTLVLFLWVALLGPAGAGHSIESNAILVHIARWAGVVFVIALGIGLAMAWQPARTQEIAARAARRIFPARIAHRVTDIVAGLVSGLDVLRDRRRAAGVVAWSLVLWFVNGLSFAACFRAFDLALPWTAAFPLQALVGFGVAVPSSPGFFGPLEAFMRLTLGLYGIPADRAVSYAVAYHIGGFIPITLIGLYELSRSQVRLGALRRAAAQSE